MEEKDGKEENEGLYCEVQETTFFSTGYFRENGFCIPQIQNSVTLKEEQKEDHKKNNGYKIYSINDVLTMNRYSTKEEYLSNSDGFNILVTAVLTIKFMLTTTTGSGFANKVSAAIGTIDYAKDLYNLYTKTSTKKLMSYKKTLSELKGILNEKEVFHIGQAIKLAKEMEKLRYKEILEADYYMHVRLGGDFQDQNRAVKNEINIVEYELSQRSNLKLA